MLEEQKVQFHPDEDTNPADDEATEEKTEETEEGEEGDEE